MTARILFQLTAERLRDGWIPPIFWLGIVSPVIAVLASIVVPWLLRSLPPCN